VTGTAVVAIGGNSLIRDPGHQTVRDQYLAAAETCHHIAAMVRGGWNLAVVHGNGPQVGFILRRSELSAHELHEVPLDVCVADTQGAIGYALQQNLQDDLRRLGLDRRVVTIVTQVEVDPADPAFAHPSKPIGSSLTEESARLREAEGWAVAEDAGRGWRRVVASPLPRRIVEEDVIRHLVEAGHIVVAAGGGGIPVVADEVGHLRGVAAVIDKDHAAALLARRIGAELFVITTSVDRVALDFGKPTQRWVDALSLEEAKRYLAEGSHFAEGSMAPKVRAAVWFVEHVGRRALITSPDALEAALEGRAGTLIGA
jgi:carbamate kinase